MSTNPTFTCTQGSFYTLVILVTEIVPCLLSLKIDECRVGALRISYYRLIRGIQLQRSSWKLSISATPQHLNSSWVFCWILKPWGSLAFILDLEAAKAKATWTPSLPPHYDPHYPSPCHRCSHSSSLVTHCLCV